MTNYQRLSPYWKNLPISNNCFFHINNFLGPSCPHDRQLCCVTGMVLWCCLFQWLKVPLASQALLRKKKWPATIWLVVSTPLKNISQLRLLFPIYGKIKKCSKPPTRIDSWADIIFLAKVSGQITTQTCPDQQLLHILGCPFGGFRSHGGTPNSSVSIGCYTCINQLGDTPMTMETPISVAQHQRHLWDDPPVPRRQVDFIELHQGGIKRCQPLPEMFKKKTTGLCQ